MTKLIPGSFLYKIVYGGETKVHSRKPFYVQNSDDYVRLLKKNYDYYGVPFKRPNVEEMPPYNKVDDTIETHVEYLDQIVVKLNVLKSGKVRVKILPNMAILNEKYYSKYKVPPIKSITSALKTMGYSQNFIESTLQKYKKRNQLIEKRWKILEKKFDTPSTSSRNKKKKVNKKVEPEPEHELDNEDEDEELEKKDDDEPEEDEAIEIDDEGDEEVVEDDYVSDGGDD